MGVGSCFLMGASTVISAGSSTDCFMGLSQRALVAERFGRLIVSHPQILGSPCGELEPVTHTVPTRTHARKGQRLRKGFRSICQPKLETNLNPNYSSRSLKNKRASATATAQGGKEASLGASNLQTGLSCLYKITTNTSLGLLLTGMLS